MSEKTIVPGTDDKWYPITDDFMFVTVFSDPERCRKLLEVILDKKIKKVTYPEGQKSIRKMRNAKSIRLDIYVEEDGEETIYDVEMQTTNTKNLPKRSRYYQGLIDLNILNAGEGYQELKRGYVIFICPFDPFEEDEYIYHFRNQCELSDGTYMDLDDGTEKIFINASGHKGNVSAEFRSLMKLISEDKAEDTFTKEIQERVAAVNRNDDWRADRVTLELKLKEARAEGKAAGLKEGKAKGRKEGELRMLSGIIRRMDSQGKTMSEISDSVGVAVAQVAKLIEKPENA